MDYIYKGEVQIYQEQLDDFLQVAQKLQIAGLVSSNSDKDVKNEPIIQEHKIEKESNKEGNQQPYVDDFPLQQPVEKASNQVQRIKLSQQEDTSELDQKIQEMISSNDGIFTCTICGKTAKLRTNLAKHIETHMDGLSFQCQTCDKSFRSRNSLQNHTSKIHSLKFQDQRYTSIT